MLFGISEFYRSVLPFYVVISTFQLKYLKSKVDRCSYFEMNGVPQNALPPDYFRNNNKKKNGNVS